MSTLRQRMREDLQIRNYAPQTIDAYVRCVAQFAQYFGTSPARLGPEQVRQYQLYLVQEKHVTWTVVVQTVCALRFLYRVTLQRPGMLAFIPQPKRPKTLPILLSPTEVAALLQSRGCGMGQSLSRAVTCAGRVCRHRVAAAVARPAWSAAASHAHCAPPWRKLSAARCVPPAACRG